MDENIPKSLRDVLHVIEGHLDATACVVERLDGLEPIADLLATDAETIAEILGGEVDLENG